MGRWPVTTVVTRRQGRKDGLFIDLNYNEAYLTVCCMSTYRGTLYTERYYRRSTAYGMLVSAVVVHHQQATVCLRRLEEVSRDRCQGAFSPHISLASSCLAYSLEPPEPPRSLWMLSWDITQSLHCTSKSYTFNGPNKHLQGLPEPFEAPRAMFFCHGCAFNGPNKHLKGPPEPFEAPQAMFFCHGCVTTCQAFNNAPRAFFYYIFIYCTLIYETRSMFSNLS
jgi:hypothetical protein